MKPRIGDKVFCIRGEKLGDGPMKGGVYTVKWVSKYKDCIGLKEVVNFTYEQAWTLDRFKLLPSPWRHLVL